MEFEVLKEVIPQIFMALVILATAVVRLIPKKVNSEKVRKITDVIHKVISYLPTLGMNPKTKQLEDFYKSQTGDKE
jgi:uncharacterized membrane protein